MLPCALLQGLAWGEGKQEEQSLFLPCSRERPWIQPFYIPICSSLTRSVELRIGEKSSQCEMLQIWGRSLPHGAKLLFWAMKSPVCASSHGRDGTAVTLPSSSRNETASYGRRHLLYIWVYWSWGEDVSLTVALVNHQHTHMYRMSAGAVQLLWVGEV